jgi:hypothetical protein
MNENLSACSNVVAFRNALNLPIDAKVDDLCYVPYNLVKEKPTNPHFFSAEERRYLEWLIVKKMVKNPREFRIAEIGASSRLLKKMQNCNNLFINRPIIEDADVERNFKVKQTIYETQDKGFMQTNFCECPQGHNLCKHIIAFKPDFIVMTHTMYYLSQGLIYNILLQGIPILFVQHLFSPFCDEGSFHNGYSIEYQWKRSGSQITMNLLSDKIYQHPEILNYMYCNSTFHDGIAYIRIEKRIRHDATDHVCGCIFPSPKDIKIPLLYIDYSDKDQLVLSLNTEKVLKDKIIIAKSGSRLSPVMNIKDGEQVFFEIEKGNPDKGYFAVRSINRTLHFKYLWDKQDLGRLLFNNSKERGFEFFNKQRWEQIFSIYSHIPEECDFMISQESFNLLCSDAMVGVDPKKLRASFCSFLRTSGKNSNPISFLGVLEAVLEEVTVLELGFASITTNKNYKLIDSIQKGTYKIDDQRPWYEFFKKNVDIKSMGDITTFLKDSKDSVSGPLVYRNKILKVDLISKYPNNYYLFVVKGDIQCKCSVKGDLIVKLPRPPTIHTLLRFKNDVVLKLKNIYDQIEAPVMVKYKNILDSLPEKIEYKKKKRAPPGYHEAKAKQKEQLKEKKSATKLSAQKGKIQKYNPEILDDDLRFLKEIYQLHPPVVNYRSYNPVMYKMLDDINTKDYLNCCFWIALMVQYMKISGFTFEKWDQCLRSWVNERTKDPEVRRVLTHIWDYSAGGTLYDDAVDFVVSMRLNVVFVIHYRDEIFYNVITSDPNDKLYAKIHCWGGHYSIENIEGYQDCFGCLNDLTQRQGGLKKYCIDEKNYESFPCEHQLEVGNDIIRYHKFCEDLQFDIGCSYEEMTQKLPCTCKECRGVMLNNVDGSNVDEWIYYQQCPRNLAFCTRRVLNKLPSEDPKVNEEIFQYYNKFWRSQIRDAIVKYFKINKEAWFNSITERSKQKEVKKFLEYARKGQPVPESERDLSYSAFGKEEFQHKGDKFRMICNPSGYHKYVAGNATKSIEVIMDKVFGGMFAVGRSYDYKENYIDNMISLGYNKWVTLDLSGFDQSHTEGTRKLWKSFINDIIELCPDEIQKYTTIEEFYKVHCADYRQIKFAFQNGKEHVPLWDIFIKDKLPSGSAFTSTLNTFVMIINVLYVRYNSGIDIVPHASGDDVLCHTTTEYSDDNINIAFYKVFQPKDFIGNWGNGLTLKYCAITTDINKIKPCSTEVYYCHNHGTKICRPFYKVVESINVSLSYAKLFKTGLPKNLYKSAIKLGDKAWYHDLPLYEKLYNNFLPKRKEMPVDMLGEYIKSKPAKFFYNVDDQLVNYYSKKKKNQFLESMARIQKYVVDRHSHKPTEPCCVEAFNSMIDNLYDNHSYLEFVLHFEEYINYSWLESAFKNYKRIQEKLERPPSHKVLKFCEVAAQPSEAENSKDEQSGVVTMVNSYINMIRLEDSDDLVEYHKLMEDMDEL